MRQTTLVAATLAVTARAAKDSRTFAVLRFNGDEPLMEGRVDPIVSMGKTAKHVHTIQGGSAFGISSTGESMMTSECSTAMIEGDNSAYWVPKLYFNDPATGLLESVDMYYMNIYYFFEPTDDDVVAFPIGLKMVAGDPDLRDCPNFGGEIQLDAGNEAGIQPAQWICPRSTYDPASRPSADESDGSTAPIQDPLNSQGGQGFPFSDCDGYASPLRMDVHFPSCYDPSKDLTDHDNNMAYPTTDWLTGKQNCPEGWIHVPHLFYEMYWNTPAFSDRWTPNQGSQPFVLSNGDVSGCAAHGDFLAAWDEAALQHIIDTCNVGALGMDKCPGVTLRDSSQKCTVPSPIDEEVTGNLTVLPGSNPLVGFGTTYGAAEIIPETPSSSSSSYEAEEPAETTTPAESYEAAAAPPPTTVYSSSSSTVQPTEAVTTATTTLADGNVVVTTIVEWVTVTTMVYDTTYTTVYVDAKKRDTDHGHAHAHNHMLRHRSPHGARK